METTTMTTRIPNKIKKKFEEICNNEECLPSELHRKVIVDFVKSREREDIF